MRNRASNHLLSKAASLVALSLSLYSCNTGTQNPLVANSITNDKIKDDAVTSGKIQDGSVATADLADGAVTANKITTGAIDISKFANYVKNGGQSTGAAVTLGTTDNNGLLFNTNGSTRLTIGNLGNVFLPGPGVNSTAATLDVTHLSNDTVNETVSGQTLTSTVAPGAASSTFFNGVYNRVNASTGSTINYTTGTLSQIIHTSGTISNSAGVTGWDFNNANGTNSSSDGVRGISDNFSTGTITNGRGVSGHTITRAVQSGKASVVFLPR
jgi:hypothetical protein